MGKERTFEKIADFVKKHCTADDYILEYNSAEQALTRFADNKITQNVDTLQSRISLTAYMDGKKATLSTADLSEDNLESFVKQCVKAAEMSVVDKEYLPSLSGSGSEKSETVSETVLEMTPEMRASVAAGAIAEAGKNKVTVYGTVSGEVTKSGIFTKNGLMKSHMQTSAGYSNTRDMKGEKGSSFSSGTGFETVDPEADFANALNDARLLQERREFEPGRYDVVLSAQAATKLFIWLGFFGADRRAVDEGYSPYSGRMGQKLLHESVSIGSDPGNRFAPCSPFDDEGLKIPARNIFENGVLKDMPCGRFWAEKNGYEPWSARNVIISSGEKSEEELLKGIKKGFYIKDLWYIRMVRMEDFTLTGMTRNGFFYVEDGKVVSGATHFRWNDSPLRMLKEIGGLGKGVGSINKWYSVFAPAVHVKDFYLSSKTLF